VESVWGEEFAGRAKDKDAHGRQETVGKRNPKRKANPMISPNPYQLNKVAWKPREREGGVS
jgi:hypothetical protein